MENLYTVGYLHYANPTPHSLVTSAILLDSYVFDIRANSHAHSALWEHGNLVRYFEKRYAPKRFIYVPELRPLSFRKNGKPNLQDESKGMSILRKALNERPVILMCSCGNIHECHRLYISKLAASKFGTQVTHYNFVNESL